MGRRAQINVVLDVVAVLKSALAYRTQVLFPRVLHALVLVQVRPRRESFKADVAR